MKKFYHHIINLGNQTHMCLRCWTTFTPKDKVSTITLEHDNHLDEVYIYFM